MFGGSIPQQRQDLIGQEQVLQPQKVILDLLWLQLAERSEVPAGPVEAFGEERVVGLPGLEGDACEVEDGWLEAWLLVYIGVVADAEVIWVIPRVLYLRIAEILHPPEECRGEEALVAKIDGAFFGAVRSGCGVFKPDCQRIVPGDVDSGLPHLF